VKIMQGKISDVGTNLMLDGAGLSRLIAQNLVYVREVRASELMTAGLIPNTAKVDPLQMLFTLCASDGRRLAVMDNRDLAFAAAREHELEPVSVH
jgi:hypothetical protein